jgi:hypothetical protein
MNIEEMKAAARRLFQLLGQEGGQSFRVNARKAVEFGLLLQTLVPRIHAVLWNHNLRDEFDRAEIVGRIMKKLLNMKPSTAAKVSESWAYFHRVVTSVKNDYLRDLISERKLRGNEPPSDDEGGEGGLPADGGGGHDGGGGSGGGSSGSGGGGAAADAYDDPSWRRLHYRRMVEKLERDLTHDEFRLLTLKAEGHSARELVAAHLDIPVSAVTTRQEGAMRERIRKILQKVRRILGPDPL